MNNDISSDQQPPPFCIDLDEEKGVSMNFCRIPAGTFNMGSRGNRIDEEPVHPVVIAEDFWMAETPVTQAQFDVWKVSVEKLYSKPHPFTLQHYNNFPGADGPVENVTWFEAKAFCNAMNILGRLQGVLPSTLVIDLPPEAHWEYACRAQSEGDYFFGDGEMGLKGMAHFNLDMNLGSEPQLPRQFQPNKWGLYDVHGGIREWCDDIYDAHAFSKKHSPWDSRSWTEKDCDRAQMKTMVARGGAFISSAFECRSASRSSWIPDHRHWDVGLRCCILPANLSMNRINKVILEGEMVSSSGKEKVKVSKLFQFKY